MTYRLVALMPMRHSSERVPGKNYRPFGDGRPLFHHTLDALKGCNLIDKIVINTDSPTIAEQCAEKYPDVIIINRPENIRGGMTPMNDVLLHDVKTVESQFYLQTHSTNPIMTSETLTNAVETFFKNYPIYDSLFSVTKVQTRFWDSLARAINHNPNILIRTQDLPPFYEENSCVYIFERNTLIERHNRIGNRPFLFEMDPYEAVDIDEEIDFRVAEEVFRQRKGMRT
ncbi:acylneuraminate cytidylyltransferase family protein [Hyphomicrobium sp.]|jgi:CMP-N-acetylneuraminic acid synthetase|uniref:acylneuraminate cytidylyltransferase family protein n=1 Tax=Hyphomicrobium sp. TaxID=82 RepID=UPI002C373149|nr:acylneuraminate cytidylyltransferase family protein [Hyphomicrobium sp.]HVU21441.1 acylneuraminate cytidylyltransferase family protein [Rhizomicrobium sp.]HVZ03551.1 acylneuraminate cytidylyltransferase family protein [Hyphomicrobium sp.]